MELGTMGGISLALIAGSLALFLLAICILLHQLLSRLRTIDNCVMELRVRPPTSELPAVISSEMQALVTTGLEFKISTDKRLAQVEAALDTSNKNVAHLLLQQGVDRDWRLKAISSLNSKLDRIGGSEEPLLETPLANWSFQRYRDELLRIRTAMDNLTPANSPSGMCFRFNEYSNELALISESAHIAENAGVDSWIASSSLSVALLIPKVLSYYALAHLYLPLAVAFLHFVEVRHVREELARSRKTANYLVEVRESDSGASLRAQWEFARELLNIPNVAIARMGLREICSSLVEMRHSCVQDAMLQFENACNDSDPFAADVWMNRCLRNVDRLLDALTLELSIHVALDDVTRFVKETVRTEGSFIQGRRKACYLLVNQESFKSTRVKRRIRLVTSHRTLRLRLQAYSRLLGVLQRAEPGQ
jgi:hypothetical protein